VGTEAYFPETSYSGREDGHSHLSIAGVKNECSYSSTFSYAFVECKSVFLHLYCLLLYLLFPSSCSYFFRGLSLYLSFPLPTIFLFLSLLFFSFSLFLSFPYFLLFLFDLHVVMNIRAGWIDE